jgi:putative membrane protein
MSDIFTDEDHMRLTQAIQRAESGTSGEIFVVVAGTADDYRLWGTVWAAIIALLAPWLLWSIGLADVAWLLVAQALVFVTCAMVLGHPALAVRLTPPAVRKAAVRERAREQFLAHGIHVTENRTGVLIFVALAEHSVEVIADTGIHARAHPGSWDAAVGDIIAGARSGQLAKGIEAAVTRVGTVLAQHWPPQADDRNELTDRVTVL